MKPKLLLKIAAVLITIHLLGHGIGHVTWDNPEDPRIREVVSSMKLHEAEFMGATKSMADYYNGYSLIIFGLYGMSILLLWFIAGFINDRRDIAHKLLYPIGVAYIFFGVIEYLYFFPFAAILSFMAGALTIVAIVTKKQP